VLLLLLLLLLAAAVWFVWFGLVSVWPRTEIRLNK
jgi:hypothetical protein